MLHLVSRPNIYTDLHLHVSPEVYMCICVYCKQRTYRRLNPYEHDSTSKCFGDHERIYICSYLSTNNSVSWWSAPNECQPIEPVWQLIIYQVTRVHHSGTENFGLHCFMKSTSPTPMIFFQTPNNIIGFEFEVFSGGILLNHLAD